LESRKGGEWGVRVARPLIHGKLGRGDGYINGIGRFGDKNRILVYAKVGAGGVEPDRPATSNSRKKQTTENDDVDRPPQTRRQLRPATQWEAGSPCPRRSKNSPGEKGMQ